MIILKVILMDMMLYPTPLVCKVGVLQVQQLIIQVMELVVQIVIIKVPSGGSTIQYVITPAGTGYTYAMYADINVSDWIHGGIKMQIISLNGAGNGDNVTVTDVSFNNYGGSNSLNTWKEVTASYTTDGI